MNVLRAIWHTQFTSIRNASRYDTRTRVATAVLLVFNIGVGFWSITRLLSRIQQWQALGQVMLTTNLWLLCIDVWVGMGFFSIIGMMSAIGNDETLLLFTLPIPPATRFRVFYSTFFVQNLWNWLLLEVGCIGYVLVATLGVQGLLWLLLLQCGITVAVACVLVLALLFIRYVLVPGFTRARMISLIFCAVLILILALSILPQLQRQRPVQSTLLLAHLNPVAVLIVFIGLFLITIGPLARPLGNLYSVTFRSLQSGGNAKNAFTLPGVHLLQRALARRRSLVTALFAKSLLNQSRNWLFWLRLSFSIALITLFPLVHAFVTLYGFSATIQVIGYASGIAVWHVLEVAPGAISGEANRLTLYLITPLKLAQIIGAKLVLFLLPVLIEGLFVALFLNWLVKLSPSQLSFVLIAVSCIITASITLPVLGSVWDEDLNATVEGRVQTLLQEETPISPKRMGLLNLSVLLFVGMLLVAWKVQVIIALASLTGIVVVIFVGMWRFSNVSLRRRCMM